MTRVRLARDSAQLGHMLLMQTWSQILALWRIPSLSLPSLILPMVFFTFFGLRFAGLSDTAGVSVRAYMLISFGAYAVGQVMVFSFGIGVAGQRAMKIDLLMRATPLPPLIDLLARIANALLFALANLLLLLAYGHLVGGVHLELSVWVTVIVRLLAGSLPFIALGFAIGYGVGANAAAAVANLVYLPLSFASGLFVPFAQLPAFVQRLAPYLPSYHYGQLARGAIGVPVEPAWQSLSWLALYTALFLTIAVRAYRREEQQRFG